jgi:hypothetical protein
MERKQQRKQDGKPAKMIPESHLPSHSFQKVSRMTLEDCATFKPQRSNCPATASLSETSSCGVDTV